MKQYIIKHFWILASFFLLAFSCKANNNEEVKFAVDKQSIEFTGEGGSQTLMVTSSKQVYLAPADNWIKAVTGTKENNQVEVTVTAEENPTQEVRQSRLAIVSGEEKIYVDITQAEGEGPVEIIPVREDNLAWRIADQLAFGWNLGNHFEAFNNGVSGETAWGNPKATAKTFQKLKAKGFTTVRIPITWLGQFGDAPTYQIKKEWMDRIYEVVGYAEDAGLYVIINMHHDGVNSQHWLNVVSAANNPEVHAQILEQITALWTQIAEKFKDKGDFLIFESFNEIQDGKWGWGANRTDGGKQYNCLNEWNQAFVDAVRLTGGNNVNRLLGVPAYCTNVDIAIESFVFPTDPAVDRLMLSVHHYDPTEYTLTAKYSEWGHTGDASKKYPGDNEAELKKIFEKIYVNYISKGIPVYMGEFGCVNRETAREQAFQQYYLKYYAKLAKLYGVPCIIWDNGAHGAGNEKHAFIDHGTGEYCSPEAKAAIEAMLNSYNNDITLKEIYNQAP